MKTEDGRLIRQCLSGRPLHPRSSIHGGSRHFVDIKSAIWKPHQYTAGTGFASKDACFAPRKQPLWQIVKKRCLDVSTRLRVWGTCQLRNEPLISLVRRPETPWD